MNDLCAWTFLVFPSNDSLYDDAASLTSILRPCLLLSISLSHDLRLAVWNSHLRSFLNSFASYLRRWMMSYQVVRHLFVVLSTRVDYEVDRPRRRTIGLVVVAPA